MAIIRIKRSTGTTAPGDNVLKNAELAYTMGTGTYGHKGGRLFIGQDSNGAAYADAAFDVTCFRSAYAAATSAYSPSTCATQFSIRSSVRWNS